MNLSHSISVLFLFTVLAVYMWLLSTTWVSLGRRSIVPLALFTLWIVLQGTLTHQGFYANNMTMPPRIMLAVGPPILIILLLAILWPSRKVIIAMPILPLLLLHSCRLPVEVVLWGLYKQGLIPQLMTFEGGNLDILSGITAPIIAFMWLQGIIRNRVLLWWNFAALALLINIVVRAVLSLQTPFQQLAFDHPNIAITQFPFIWLPAFIVPVVLFCHVAVIVHIWMDRKYNVARP